MFIRIPPRNGLLRKRTRRYLQHKEGTWISLTAIALSICLLATDPAANLVSAAEPTPAQPAAHAPAEDGFTRESMAALGQPDPAPVPTGPIVSPPVVRSLVDSRHHVIRHRHAMHVQRVRMVSRVAAIRLRPHRRNPVVSFVYWWNGFLIRRFHTKFGTVMLHTVGAKM